jgi:hypothetical protein
VTIAAVLSKEAHTNIKLNSPVGLTRRGPAFNISSIYYNILTSQSRRAKPEIQLHSVDRGMAWNSLQAPRSTHSADCALRSMPHLFHAHHFMYSCLPQPPILSTPIPAPSDNAPKQHPHATCSPPYNRQVFSHPPTTRPPTTDHQATETAPILIEKALDPAKSCASPGTAPYSTTFFAPS